MENNKDQLLLQHPENPLPLSEAKHSGRDFPHLVKPEWILIAGLVLLLFVGIFTIDDYGMNVDSDVNYQQGKANLDFLLTGQMDWNVLRKQMHGAFFVLIAEVSKRLLHDTLHLYEPISARQITLPFLTAVFLFFLFRFIQKHWGAWHGLITVGLLLTFPYFWGSAFNNQKDIPLLVFFSLAVMSFVDWVTTGKLRFFYGFFIFWGCALAIKLHALLVLPLLLFWLIIKPRSEENTKMVFNRRALILHATAGLCMALSIFLVFYMPMFWGIEHKMSFLLSWQNQVKAITIDQSKSFNLMPFIQILSRTPELVLFFALAGIAFAIKGYRRNHFHSLLLIWVSLPVIFHCLPGTVYYTSGMRHYFMFLVPWTILATSGLYHLAEYFTEKTRVYGRFFMPAMILLMFGLNLFGIVMTHPYETSYFNLSVGGMRGAQDKKIYFDDWFTCHKEAAQWIKENGRTGANVLELAWFPREVLARAINRPDIKILERPEQSLSGKVFDLPPNTYVIYVPTYNLTPQGMILEFSVEFEKVHYVERQGGEIFAIYYKPQALMSGDPMPGEVYSQP